MIERGIWRSAKALIDNYGDDATIHAAMRAFQAKMDRLVTKKNLSADYCLSRQ